MKANPLTDSRIIGEIDPATSVLFLGSGFSLGATNIAGSNPPNGSGLRRHFITELGLPEETSYDLQVLTDEFAERDQIRLYNELYRIFHINKLSDSQIKILNEPWRRIYTTNYDDSAELHRLQSMRPINTYDPSRPLPSKLPEGSIIHLHGSIREITPDNVLSSLILGEKSYVNNLLKGSLWYEQFLRDVRLSTQIFFVGYSLADYHIAALLLADPALTRQIFFIQGKSIDEILLRRTKDYGQTLFIGDDGFAKALQELPRNSHPKDLSRLKGFRSLHPLRDKKSISNPTTAEVYDLLVYGKFSGSRLAQSLPSQNYTIARPEQVGEAINLLEKNRTIVVESRLGNGKTIFLHLLASSLSAIGFTCVMFRPDVEDIGREIDALKSIKKLAIFFENYSLAQDLIRIIGDSLPDSKFIIEIRTAVFEVRLHEINRILPKPYDRITLNRLSTTEMDAFVQLCKTAGIFGSTKEFTQYSELRDILLGLFSNKSISDRIESTLKPIFESKTRRRILVMSMLTASVQGTLNPGFIRSVTGADPFVEFMPVGELASEVFEITSDCFRVRSAIFSEFVVNAFLNAEEIADCIIDVTLAAAQRKAMRPYRILMSNLMAFSGLHRGLKRRSDAISVIISIYERLRYDTRIMDEPLFWLQYAIAMSEICRLDIAQEHIETAYGAAAQIPEFKTYQIDTQAFRIVLLSAINSKPGNPVSQFQDILAGIERINIFISEESHRTYAIRVLEYIPQFYAVRKNDLTIIERNALRVWLNILVGSLKALPIEIKSNSDSDKICHSIESII